MLTRKSIAIAVSGSGQVMTALIEPGVTVADLKRELDLNNFVFSRPNSSAVFVDSEEVYPLVPDGGKLVATQRAEVGSPRGPTWSLSPEVICMGVLQDEGTRQVGRNRPIHVVPKAEPLWRQRGWRRKKDHYTGYYLVGRRKWRGEAMRPWAGRMEFYIYSPPKRLLSGPHGSCFQRKGWGRYRVHFRKRPPNIDSGILTIEQMLEGR